MFIFGIDGFIPGSRATFVMDCVAASMLLVVALLSTSLYVVKYRRAYQLHKSLQIFTSIAVVIVLILFEIDIRIFGWMERAAPSPYYDTILFPYLCFHVTIATGTSVFWTITMWTAIKNFPKPPGPNFFSLRHKKNARFAVIGMYLTAVTGVLFYYLAFVAA